MPGKLSNLERCHHQNIARGSSEVSIIIIYKKTNLWLYIEKKNGLEDYKYNFVLIKKADLA